MITTWHDRKIGAGTEWRGQIDTHLNAAHIILLLISSDFLASDYCRDVEVKRAMERHEAEEARVIPIILRPAIWQGAPFEKLQALPKDAKSVTTWSNQDEAFVSVAEGIRSAVDELLNTLRADEDTSRTISEAPANFQSSPPERVRGDDGGAVADQTLVICFTDLQDFNSHTEYLGRNSYPPYHLKDHFSIAETLTKLAGGDYVTNTNHGNIVLFKSGEQAINFALQLQEFYVERHCLIRRPLKLGIGLCFGQVQRTETGVLGSGAEQAAHVLSKAGLDL